MWQHMFPLRMKRSGHQGPRLAGQKHGVECAKSCLMMLRASCLPTRPLSLPEGPVIAEYRGGANAPPPRWDALASLCCLLCAELGAPSR
jgi:hypothetical protein